MFVGMNFEFKGTYMMRPTGSDRVMILTLRVMGDFDVKAVEGWAHYHPTSGYETRFSFYRWASAPAKIVESYGTLREQVGHSLPALNEERILPVIETMQHDVEATRRYILNNLKHYQMFTTSTGLVKDSNTATIHIKHDAKLIGLPDGTLVTGPADNHLSMIIYDSNQVGSVITGSVGSLISDGPRIRPDLLRTLDQDL